MAKHIVLTGVSRGLGRALTKWFAEHGHTVSGCARSADAVAELSTQWDAPHSFAEVDVADAVAVEDWARKVQADKGAPDLLINNAALIHPNAPLWEIPQETFSQLIDVNLKGVFHVIRAFLPAMLAAGRGIVVNLSSGWGRSVSAEVAGYCTTKWGIEGMTRALAEDLPAGLAAVPLNPGIIDTDMLRSCFGSGAGSSLSPDQWAERAGPYILGLSHDDNGQAMTVN